MQINKETGELFGPIIEGPLGLPLDDMEEVYDIDMDGLDNESKNSAGEVIEIVTSLYHKGAMEAHPQLKRRIDLELETIRGLIKMRKADEIAHDAILKAISENKNNASMYRSLADIQKTSLSITTKIHETLDRLQNMLKGFQLEFDFDDDESEEESDEPEVKDTHRGSKSFIQQMINSENNENLKAYN